MVGTADLDAVFGVIVGESTFAFVSIIVVVTVGDTVGVSNDGFRCRIVVGVRVANNVVGIVMGWVVFAVVGDVERKVDGVVLADEKCIEGAVVVLLRVVNGNFEGAAEGVIRGVKGDVMGEVELVLRPADEYIVGAIECRAVEGDVECVDSVLLCAVEVNTDGTAE